jgi:hypothetical protein
MPTPRPILRPVFDEVGGWGERAAEDAVEELVGPVVAELVGPVVEAPVAVVPVVSGLEVAPTNWTVVGLDTVEKVVVVGV